MLQDRVTVAEGTVKNRTGMSPMWPLLTIAMAVAATGCSSWQQALYYSGQNWQTNECQKIPNALDRERCLKQSGTTYEDYQREMQKSNK
jgi:hypothetical protein